MFKSGYKTIILSKIVVCMHGTNKSVSVLMRKVIWVNFSEIRHVCTNSGKVRFQQAMIDIREHRMSIREAAAK